MTLRLAVVVPTFNHSESPEAVCRANVVARQELWVASHGDGETPDRAEYLADRLGVPSAVNGVSYRCTCLLDVQSLSAHCAAHITGEERKLPGQLLVARGQ